MHMRGCTSRENLSGAKDYWTLIGGGMHHNKECPTTCIHLVIRQKFRRILDGISTSEEGLEWNGMQFGIKNIGEKARTLFRSVYISTLCTVFKL